MNIKRIISTALLVVMMFTTIVAAMPFAASAAYSDSSANAQGNIPEGTTPANLTSAELEAYMNEYLSTSSGAYTEFESAAERLNYELAKGYLYYSNSSGNEYTLFVNKYTGFVYYVNNVTGQILTSNPINVSRVSGLSDRESLMSQIVIRFSDINNPKDSGEYNSIKWAARRAQISISAMKNGFRVNYTLGDTSSRFLLPGMVLAEDFEESILIPFILQYQQLVIDYCSEECLIDDLYFFDDEENEIISNYEYEDYGYINYSSDTGLLSYLSDTKIMYTEVLDKSSEEYIKINKLNDDIKKIVANYVLQAPIKYLDEPDRYAAQLKRMYEEFPITKDGTAIYAYSGSQESATKRQLSSIIKKNLPEYTFTLMYEQEAACAYVAPTEEKEVFRCALEYTFNSDNSLSVRLPANSIVFDESKYVLDEIVPLQYFGAGNMKNSGYLFYPDGSGTIVEFDEFYSETKLLPVQITAPVYGLDYCYSKLDKIDGITFRAQVTMPVYGIVNEVVASEATKLLYGKETVTNGYFAIIEEGSALANITAASGGASHEFIGAYSYYSPTDSDMFEASEALSVGGNKNEFFKMISKVKYQGSYTTRYVMLCDEELGNEIYGENAFYKSGYVGMATYYRDYLKNNGVLTALENLNETLPLYIESIGAMDILSKFLTFPVNETISLTKFSDIKIIYDELAKCEELVITKAAEYQALADNEKDEVQKYQYQKEADRYKELIGKVKNIVNVNFKLTGFANGGYNNTYPVKLKWVKECGGKSGFKSLIEYADTVSAKENSNLSIFPDFDFEFIHATSTFDGVSFDDFNSTMVDNRYAVKQKYNSITQLFEATSAYVVSPDTYSSSFAKFNKSYSKYNNKNISLSTFGSTLNSNFNEDNTINREDAMNMVESMLDTVANKNGYNVMTDAGNIYAMSYAKHILNAPIDSSHHRYSSYTVPFVAMVLHSYVSYTGEPINYSGSPDYDRLRAIESGAALYYIVCYREDNIVYMKNDSSLNKYYGVNYNNWYDSIVDTYYTLDNYIGSLQAYEIVDHKTLIAEREIEDYEQAINYIRLQDEILEFLDVQLQQAADKAILALKGDEANYDKRIKLDVKLDALMVTFADILNIPVAELYNAGEGETSFADRVAALANEYTSYYCGAANAENTVVVEFSSFIYGEGDYVSKYSYVTDSYALDKDYVYTDYTIDNNNVTMVTYKNGTSTVRFILNYNNYKVTVRLSATEVYELSGYDCVKIVD